MGIRVSPTRIAERTRFVRDIPDRTLTVALEDTPSYSIRSWRYASPNCFRLFVHWCAGPASRADCTAGNRRAINTAMIAMTTSNSISVKPKGFRKPIRLSNFMGETPCGG